MDHWTPQDWAFFLTSVATFVGALSSIVAAFMSSLAKLKGDANGLKLDKNTEITQEGASAATANAKTAAEAANRTKTVAEHIDRKLNGGIDAAISEAIAPLKSTLEEHAKTTEEIKGKVNDLAKYVRDRNHDMLDALSVQANKVNTLLVKLEKEKP